MGWLASHTWHWLLLSALLGALPTWLLIVRRYTVRTVTERRVTAPTPKAAEIPDGPYGLGSAVPLAGGTAPHGRFTVKGNIDSGLYHTGESPTYLATIAEVWFDTEERAIAAGFKRWDSNKRAAELVDEEIPDGPYGVGSAAPLVNGASPHTRYTVKGNANSGLYHALESPFYAATIAEVWFDTEERAQAAGFKRWDTNL